MKKLLITLLNINSGFSFKIDYFSIFVSCNFFLNLESIFLDEILSLKTTKIRIKQYE